MIKVIDQFMMNVLLLISPQMFLTRFARVVTLHRGLVSFHRGPLNVRVGICWQTIDKMIAKLRRWLLKYLGVFLKITNNNKLLPFGSCRREQNLMNMLGHFAWRYSWNADKRRLQTVIGVPHSSIRQFEKLGNISDLCQRAGLLDKSKKQGMAISVMPYS